MRILGLLIILLWPCINCLAQKVKKDSATVPLDSTVLTNDSVRVGKKRVVDIETYSARFDPRKALFYSAVLPGAGQAYNKKYWKIPLVYGGIISLVAVVKFYNDAELKYRDLLFTAINQPSTQISPFGLTNSQLITQLRPIVDQARRQRDYFAILTGLFYILQMVDAHVDAHLKEFDLNPKLHVRVEPGISPSGSGIGLTFRF
jgi:hypothetical protein